MRAQRLRTGLHRIGIVGAVACGIAAAGLLGLAAYHYAAHQPDDASNAAGLGTVWLAGAVAFYAVFWAIGWILAGFTGDGDSTSKE